ncbi:MAG: NAD(P)-dependent alcohol dehydrogenase [Bacteroidota bacterium]
MNTPTMKAVYCSRYGRPEVLQIRTLAQPQPHTGEVLIRVKAAAVTTADTMMRKGTPFFARFFLGLRQPSQPIPGTGFAGEIVALGPNVKRFKVGDAVFGETTFHFSANAEYLCLPEDGVLLTKPNNMSFAEAAPVCDGALTALHFLRDLAKVKAGQSLLVIGASGSIGTAAVQLGKYLGARVTGICSASNHSWVKTLGATEVIDYRTTDFTELKQQYDFIFDTVGKSHFSKCKKALTPRGMYLSPVLSKSLLFQVFWTKFLGGKSAKFSATGMQPVRKLRDSLQDLKTWIEAGHLTSVMDRDYSLEQVVAAHRYIDTGRKKGNVVLLP